MKKDVMFSLINDVFVPLNDFYAEKIHSDSTFYKLFGIYKIAMLPIYKEKDYNEELNKLLKIYTNKNLILDEETKNFFEMFLFLYFNWLRKYDNESLIRLSKLLEIDKFMEINNFTNITVKIEDFRIVNSKELVNNEGVDKDILLDIKDIINEYKILSRDDKLVNDVYVESFLKLLNELTAFLKEYDEFEFLIMLLEKIKNFYKKIDYYNLDIELSREIKIVTDEIVDFIEKWINEVFYNDKEIDVTYLDAFILSEITKLEILFL